MNNILEIPGTDAINLTSIPNIQSFIPEEDGFYAVTMTSDVTYHNGHAPLDQAFIFNCSPLVTGDTEKWDYIINVKQGVTLTGKKDQPIYAFMVDQINSDDNTGKAEVKFTKIN